VKKTVIFIVISLLVFSVLIYYLESQNPLSDELGAYTSSLSNRSSEQLVNINIAAGALNDFIVEPGGLFSFNQVAGPYTVAAGFRDAPQIKNGRYENNIGGGICQVSSTLYNAILLSKLEVVERVPHQFVINSVPLGLDATVALSSTHSADLKFKNNRAYPVKISVKTAGERLTAMILGKRRDSMKVEIVVERMGRANAIVYRVTSIDGKRQSKELISKDSYKEG